MLQQHSDNNAIQYPIYNTIPDVDNSQVYLIAGTDYYKQGVQKHKENIALNRYLYDAIRIDSKRMLSYNTYILMYLICECL